MRATQVSAPRRLGELLAAGAEWLERRGVAEARLDCELLAARLLRLPRLSLPMESERLLPQSQVEALRRDVLRLASGEPLQYVLAEWDFRGHTLTVDRRALVPRPETEQLVQQILDTPEVWRHHHPAIADIGTGSGCIVIALALERPAGRYLAIEREAGALELARENAARHGVAERIAFRQGEGCCGVAPGSLDAIVSNPPYIATGALAALPRNVRDFEPRAALDGGADGLAVLREIVHDAAMTLRPRGWCFLEIGDDQGSAVRSLLERAGFAECAILRDLAGKVRYARGRLP
jgi:release factor glutamine methyltransferase